MRITIVSYHFTPSTMVAALRARGLAKYLSRMGHQVTVITAEAEPERSDAYEVLSIPNQTPSSRMRSALGVSQHHTVVDAISSRGPARLLAGPLRLARTIVGELLFWPDEAIAWARRISPVLAERLAEGATDAVITTSPPPSTHLAMLALRQSGVTWVADYRDLWTIAHHYPHSPLRRAFDRRTDARIFGSADIVTVATEGFAQVARQHFPTAEIATVYNGFDPEMFPEHPATPANERLTLVHAGSLYGGRVDPEVLFTALRTLIDEGRVPADAIHVDFFSAAEEWLARSVAAHGLLDVVTVHGNRPRAEVIEAYVAADVLVLLQWDTPGERAVLPAKLLEYLGSGRPVLAVGAPEGGEAEALLRRTGAGVVARDVPNTAEAIARFFDEWRRTGAVARTANQDILAEFTHAAMARTMAEAIERARASR